MKSTQQSVDTSLFKRITSANDLLALFAEVVASGDLGNVKTVKCVNEKTFIPEVALSLPDGRKYIYSVDLAIRPKPMEKE